MTSNMISASVKFLNGDLIEIQHKPSRGFEHFVKTIYNTCEHIPYGCLVLKRIPFDNDNLDEVSQIMLLPDIYSTDLTTHDDHEVTEVYDQDSLCAFVDNTLVTPYILRDKNVAIPSSNPKFQKIVYVYSISFRSHNDNHESQTIVFHDTDNSTFALCDTFILPTPQEASEYHRDGLLEVYKPTLHTIWFPTLSECLLSSMDRFPHDQDTIQTIENKFHIEDWSQWSQPDDEIDYEYDYEYDRDEYYDEYNA